jgi:hypothetical protein
MTNSRTFYNKLLMLVHLLAICHSLEYKHESLSSTYLFRIEHISFTNDSYSGYISENVATPIISSSSSSSSLLSSSVFISTASSPNTQPISKSIYIRFVDRVKPALRFTMSSLGHANATSNDDFCKKFDLAQLNLTLVNSNEDSADYTGFGSATASKSDLFELDLTRQLCRTIVREALTSTCECYTKVKLIDGQSVRDRINREAKDVYQLQLRAGSSSKSTLLINILDDNDLEPMFESSEYSINLDEYVLSGSSINRNSLPEFSVVGRVLATDPDLEANSQARFYIHSFEGLCGLHFGINWLNGEVYLKQSLQTIFDSLKDSALINECQLEIKSVDTGLKFNTMNNLLTVSGASMSSRNGADLDAFNRFLIQTAASLNSSSVSGIFNQKLTGQESLESSIVRISLRRNLETMLESILKRTVLTVLDKQLAEVYQKQIEFVLDRRAGRVPFSLVRFETNSATFEMNLNRVQIKATNSSQRLVTFRLARVYNQTEMTTRVYLLYFDLNTAVNEFMNAKTSANLRWVNYKMDYCASKNRCVRLVEFNFDFGQDFNSIISTLCKEPGMSVQAPAQNAKFANNSIVFNFDRVNSIQNLVLLSLERKQTESKPSFCAIFSNSPLKLQLNARTSNFELNKRDQLVLTNDFLSQNETLLVTSNEETFLDVVINYSNSYNIIDQLVQSTQMVSNQKSIVNVNAKFSSGKNLLIDLNSGLQKPPSMIYCKLVYLDGSIENDLFLNSTIQNCPFYLTNDGKLYSNQSITRFDSIFKSANVLIQVENTTNSLITDYYFVNVNISINNSEKTLRGGDSEEMQSLHELKISYTVLDSNRDSTSTSSNGNNLDIPILIAKFDNIQNMDENIEFTFRVINQTIDAKCFSINKFSGDLFLKCKIPFSVLNQFYYGKKQLVNELSVVKRLVEINCRIKQEQTDNKYETHNLYLEIGFELSSAENVVKMLDRTTINNLQPVGLTLQTLNNARANRTDEIIQQYLAKLSLNHEKDNFVRVREHLMQRKHRISEIKTPSVSEMTLTSSNVTHFNFDLVFKLQNFTSNKYVYSNFSICIIIDDLMF